MAILFMEGWDATDTGSGSWVCRKWDGYSNTPSPVGGRFGGKAMQFQNAYLYKTLPATYTTLVSGCALFLTTGYNFNNGTPSPLMCFQDSGASPYNQVDVRWTTAGKLVVTRNGAVILGPTADTIPTNQWVYIELKATIHASAGVAELRLGLNGAAPTAILSGTDLNTQATGNAYANRFLVSSQNTSFPYIDDIYVCDTSGSVNNDFLGDCRVVGALANAEGTTTDWTPNSGTTHYNRVNEWAVDDDSSYESATTPGVIDLFNFPDYGVTGAIAGVAFGMIARKADVGTRKICEECRSAAANYEGSLVHLLNASYAYFRQFRENDPATGLPWTLVNLNAAQFGMRVVPNTLNERAAWTAFATGYFGAGYEPSKMIDDDTGTRWVGANGHTFPYSIWFDMGASWTFNSVGYLPRQDAGSLFKGVDVYVSADGINWGSIIGSREFNYKIDSVLRKIYFPQQTKRWLKLTATSGQLGGGAPVGCAEIYIYNDALTGIPARSEWAAFADDIYSNNAPFTYDPMRALDGSTATFWVTTDAPPHDFWVDMARSATVSGITITPRQDGPTDFPLTAEIYCSTDGVNWGSAVASPTFANDNTQKTVSFTPTTARFVKFHCLTSARYVSLSDFTVTG